MALDVPNGNCPFTGRDPWNFKVVNPLDYEGLFDQRRLFQEISQEKPNGKVVKCFVQQSPNGKNPILFNAAKNMVNMVSKKLEYQCKFCMGASINIHFIFWCPKIERAILQINHPLERATSGLSIHPSHGE